MDDLGLTRHEREQYHDTIARDHERRLSVAVTNLNHKRLTDLPAVLDGQVVVRKVDLADAATQATRVLSMTFLDPDETISWDPDSPSDTALWIDRMLVVEDARYVPGLGWVEAQPFIGPVVGYERDGDVVRVTAWGKEWLAQQELGEARRWPAGTKVVEIIRDLMQAAGETRFDFGESPKRIPHALSLAAKTIIWVEVQKLARSIDRQLYYPGNGRCTLRILPGSPVFRFHDGTGGFITSEVAITTAFATDFHNVVVVFGRKPREKKKKRVTSGPIAPPDNHPLSPQKFQRNGIPIRRVLRKENPKLRTAKACIEYARRLLRDELVKVTDVRFECMPVSHLDEGDLLTVEQRRGQTPFRLKEQTIPVALGDGNGTATAIGFLKNTSYRSRRKRKK